RWSESVFEYSFCREDRVHKMASGETRARILATSKTRVCWPIQQESPMTSSIRSRRDFLAALATTGAVAIFATATAPAFAGTNAPSSAAVESVEAAQASAAMRMASTEAFATGAATVRPDDTSIRPFKFHATDEELADLKRRIKATKWPEREID